MWHKVSLVFEDFKFKISGGYYSKIEVFQSLPFLAWGRSSNTPETVDFTSKNTHDLGFYHRAKVDVARNTPGFTGLIVLQN